MHIKLLCQLGHRSLTTHRRQSNLGLKARGMVTSLLRVIFCSYQLARTVMQKTPLISADHLSKGSGPSLSSTFKYLEIRLRSKFNGWVETSAWSQFRAFATQSGRLICYRMWITINSLRSSFSQIGPSKPEQIPAGNCHRGSSSCPRPRTHGHATPQSAAESDRPG